MTIQFSCPKCAATIRVPDEDAGKELVCGKCSAKVAVPLPGKPFVSEADIRRLIDLAKFNPDYQEVADPYNSKLSVGDSAFLLIFAVIGALILAGLASQSLTGFVLIFFTSISSIVGFKYLHELGERERFRSDRERSCLSAETRAAQDTTIQKEWTESYFSALNAMPELLDTAKHHLDVADQDFEAKAFGPFWDTVQESVRALDAFRHTAETARESFDEYHSRLIGRNHTFPALPNFVDRLPSPLPTLQRLKEIVRKGQTDFQFATIWEQRRTRDALIAGFHSWADALSQIESQVVAAFRAFR